MDQQRFGNLSSTSYGATATSGDFGGNRLGGSTFEDLSREISSKIFKINSNTTEIGRYGKKLDSRQEDVTNVGSKIHNVLQQTNQLVNEVTTLLRQLHDYTTPVDKMQKIQFDRLTNSFKTTVEKYGEVQKKVSIKMKSTSLMSQSQGYDESRDTWSEEANLIEHERRREQLQQQHQVVEDELAIAREREERIKQIETDVLDVNQIFKELGAMVFEQGEIVNDIESNVTSTADNVTAGNQQLMQAEKYQKSYRKKLCILAVIVIIIAGVLALILGLSLKKK